MYQPTRPRSPYGPPQSSPQIQPQIQPGALTYTTTTGPDGRPVYNTFRAMAASYQTPNGIVHGIQWLPADATHILPAGAQPATAEFSASWNKSSEYDRERQREEEKKRKKKEKEEAKARERRKSFVGANPPVAQAFPSAGPGYPASPYAGSTSPYVGSTSPYATPSNKPYSDLDRQFEDLGISGRPRTISGNYGSPPYGTGPHGTGPQSRPYASTGPHISAYANPSPNMRAADVLPSTSTGYPASPYSVGKHVDPVAPIARSASPQPYGATTSAYGYPPPPRSRATTPIPGSVPAPAYPQPRSRAPSPMPAYPRSRPVSPMPAYPRSRPVSPMPTPAIPSNQPTVPEGFSRPVNAALSFPPFEPIKIHDMDDFLTRLPKLPMVLQPHDVGHHDWIRLTQDMSLAWAGKMPVPPERAANPPKRPNLVAELLHAWNTAFFIPRAVEVVLYKGNTRYSGPKAGIADLPHRRDDDDDDDDDSSSSSGSSSDEPFYGAPPQSASLYGNQYGPPVTHPHYAAEVQEARRKRHEEKAERKRRRKERRLKRKQREREKKFSLYVTFNPTVPSAMPGGYSTRRPGGY